MPEPFLDLGDVGLVVEGVGRGRRAQGMNPDPESHRGGVLTDQFVDAIWRNRFFLKK